MLPSVQSENGEGLCLQRIAFQKPMFTIEPPRCHVNLTYMPTHVENDPSAHKGEYTWAHRHMPQLLPLWPTRTTSFSSNSFFLLSFLSFSTFHCFSCWRVGLKTVMGVFFSPWIARDHK